MDHIFTYSGGSEKLPLFPGKYRIECAQEETTRPGDILEGTITIDSFIWGFINIGSSGGFNSGKTDFRIRSNMQADTVMSTPGEGYSGYLSGYQDHEVHFRGYKFEDAKWKTRANTGEGYVIVEMIEEYPAATNLFNLKAFYNVGDPLGISLPNNQTNNRIEYFLNGVWREVYTGRDTFVNIDTSRVNRNGRLRYRIEVGDVYKTVGESRPFVVGQSSELEATVNIGASNRFIAAMEIVPPPYITHSIIPNKDSLVREKVPHVNYGNSSSLIVGASEEEKNYETYLAFSLDKVPKEEDLDAAILTLKLQRELDNLEVLLYETDNDWLERAIRWENKPEHKNLIYQQVVSSAGNRLLEIDLTDFVTDWYKSGGEEKSFAMVLKTEEDEIVYFGSKESSNPPVLKVSYYKLPPNAGVYHLDADVVVAVRSDSELKAEVDIDSDFMAIGLEAEVEFVKKENDSEIDADALVAIVDVSDLTSEAEFEAKHDSTEIDADTFLRAYEISEVDAFADIERKDAVGDLDAEAIIVIHDESELEAEFEIEAKEVSSYLDAEALLRAYDFSEISADTLFENKFGSTKMEADAFVRAYGELTMNATVEFEAKTGDTEIDASAEFFEKETSHDLDVNALLAVRWAEELEVEVEVEVTGNKGYAFIM